MSELIYKKSLSPEELELNETIKKNGVMYFFRSTPFSAYSEFNYNGDLKEDFFFDHLFSSCGNCEEYTNAIKEEIINRNKKSIVLIGNQGCGKTTFLYNLQREMSSEFSFHILDFDKNTSNPKLADYIEIFSRYLFGLIYSDYSKTNCVNKMLYNIYICNRNNITNTINASNNIESFFGKLHRLFINKEFSNNTPEGFINDVDKLFFNQILSLIVLWYIAEFTVFQKISKKVFCLDNLDVLVNSEIINGFFEEYFTFARNIDSIIQKLATNKINNTRLEYNKIFTFIFSCRQHTWAKVKMSYLHQSNVITLSTFEKDITDAFDKNRILDKRTEYIVSYFDSEFIEKVKNVKSLIEDLKEWHNIYDLFDDDYRQCAITFEKLLQENDDLLSEYVVLRKTLSKQGLYGARGLIFKALFDKFRDEDLFNSIGVLDVRNSVPPVSNVRIILNYLDHYTYSNNSSVPFERMIQDFSGIVDRESINNSLIQMFNLGVKESLWNELIAFVQIDNDELDDCNGKRIFITKAGHEYLDLIATHFEFFNCRVYKARTTDIPLFSKQSLSKYEGSNKNFTYNFQETIQNVIDIVNGCCKKMSKFYDDIMFQRFGSKENYLDSEFVYGNSRTKVFHGERIIHTHIRYIDHFRLHVLNGREKNKENNQINKILIDYIKKYISIGENNPQILSSTSTVVLFPKFKEKIQAIESCGYNDFKTAIDT